MNRHIDKQEFRLKEVLEVLRVGDKFKKGEEREFKRR